MNYSQSSGWEVIRLREQRRIRAEQNRKPAFSADQHTGTERFNGHSSASYLEIVLGYDAKAFDNLARML